MTLVASAASAQQTNAPPPCSAAENRSLDFWVGDWVAKWDQGGQKGTGTNRITRDEYGACVITEHFHSDDGTLNGHSVSTYRPGIKQWRQNWVDDQGGYFDLVGNPVSGADHTFFFETKRVSDKQPYQRMIFQDVKPDSFTCGSVTGSSSVTGRPSSSSMGMTLSPTPRMYPMRRFANNI